MLASLLIAFLLQSAAPEPAKTAIVRGRVLSADTGAPLKYAHITLRMNGTTRETASVTADSNGVYEIRDIDPGTYSPTAGKAGYIATSYKGPEDVSTLKLTAGQVATGIDFRLPRGAVISGTVIDIDGEPVPGATIQAMVKVYRQGKVELQNRGMNTQTDDHGDYRLHNLPAGRYYLQAGKGGNNNGIAQSAPLAAQYYANASRMEDAQGLRLAPGEERQGINFSLHDAQGLIFSGKIVSAETGQPLECFINLFPMVSGMSGNASGRSNSNGTFRFPDIGPGTYGMMINVFNTGGGNSGVPNSIMRYVDVNPSTTNTTIRVGRGISIKGQLKAEGGDLPDKLSLSLQARSISGNSMGGAGTISAADGTFEFKNVQPGTYDFTVNRSVPIRGSAPAEPPKPMRFFVGPVMASGQDAMDTPFVVGEDATGMEIAATIDFRAATINGKILDENDKPLPGTNIAIVSVDPKKRLLTHYWRGFKCDKDGKYEAWNLIPGDYFLIPWAGDEVGQVLDPDVFIMLEKHAVRVKVALNDKITQDLHLTKELKTIADTFSQ